MMIRYLSQEQADVRPCPSVCKGVRCHVLFVGSRALACRALEMAASGIDAGRVMMYTASRILQAYMDVLEVQSVLHECHPLPFTQGISCSY